MLDAQRILRTIKLKIRKSIKSNVFFNLEGGNEFRNRY